MSTEADRPIPDDGGAVASERPARIMENMPVVDLSGVRDRRDVVGLRLRNIGMVLVPEDIPDLAGGADCKNVGAIVPVPTGTRVDSRVGQLEIAGEGLAAGDDHTILSLVGQVVVTPGVTAVGYRGLILVGQILVPRQAQGLLAGKIINQTGQILYYDAAGPLRVFMHDTQFTKAFFDLVDQSMTLVLLGDCSFAADVTPSLLRAKVANIVLLGDACVEDAALQPVVQFLATTLAGSITVGNGEDPEDEDEDDEDDA